MRSNFSSLMKNQNNPLSHKCEAGVSLLERTVGLGIEEAYPELKALLLERCCRIIADEAPVLIYYSSLQFTIIIILIFQ